MLHQHTLTTLKLLKLPGMAAAFEEQLIQPVTQSLSFNDRFGLIVDREASHRDNQRLGRLLKNARLKHNACVEDIDYRSGRGLDKSVMANLIDGDWIRQAQNLILTGATGCGKTWLACALGNQACRQGMSVPVSHISRTRTILSGSSMSFIRALMVSRCGLVVMWPAWLQAGGSSDRLPVMTILTSGQPGSLVRAS